MNPLDKILKNLNDEQSEAVTAGAGPLLVLAGAGSGKTRVLTHRIAYFVAQKVPPFKFLAVTFTNKAAGEMRGRIKKLVHADVWVSTFHSSCLRILKDKHKLAGLGKYFTVYDDNDQIALIKECCADLKLDEKQYNAKSVRERINRAKDALITPKSYEEEIVTFYDEKVGAIYALYEKKLAQYNGIDFGGLILKCIELFRNHSEVLSAYQRRFQYIFIDEYQDTNHAQYQWVKLLAGQHKNITVVGDPDQSIYGWRGADIGNILSFEKDYPDARVITLDKNYRSTKNILDASNAIIAHNCARKEKELWTDKDEGDRLHLYEARDEREEAEFLAHQILRLKQEGGHLDNVVVFYRVHAQSRIVEDYLRRFNIPYRIVGGVRFYDRKEIRDIIAYLKVIACPEDEVSLKRIINVPARSIGTKTLEVLFHYQKKHGLSLYATLGQAHKISQLTNRKQTAITRFYKYIQSLRAKRNAVLPSALIADVLEVTGYLNELERAKSFEARARIENIKEFLDVVIEFEEQAVRAGQTNLVHNFLDMISLQTSVDEWDQSEGTLTLMTIHCAKGLEFDFVFIVGMEEDIFPHANVLKNAERELEEERRLCYVGITRARKKVVLSYAQTRRLYGMRMQNMPSRFLGEIPDQYLLFLNTIHDDDHYLEDEEVEEVVEYDYGSL